MYLSVIGRVARAGRSGTAYSMLSPDEMPFLIDLHLFLGRPLKFSTAQNNKRMYDHSSVTSGKFRLVL